MTIYVKAIKAYGYLRYLLGILLLSAAAVLVLILLANLIAGQLEFYRVWVVQHLLLLLVLALITLMICWQRLMPTLRTVFKVKHSISSAGPLQRLKDNERLLAIFAVGIMLFAFAYAQKVELFDPLMKHPARYGYMATAVLAVALLVLMAKLSAPSKAKVDTGIFVNDDPKEKPSLTVPQQQAVQYLKGILASGMPRSVALTGDWGSGKTAVYHKARAGIGAKHPDIIWVDFDPWRYTSEEALVKGFYETIAKQIEVVIPGYQNALRSIAHSVDQLVSKNDTSGILQSISTVIKGSAGKSMSPDGIIKGLLDREGRRLVIVLDDVERQYDAERTYRALQLVHHAKTMGRDNVQVLCIFEKATLLLAAPTHMPSREEYLEKFSEIEINVALPDEASLRAQLDELLDNPQYSKHFPEGFKLDLSHASVRDIKSHRGVIRAFNELLLDFISTKDRDQVVETEHGEVEVNAFVDSSDRFLMGHLKLKYPIIYRDITVHRNYYTQSKASEDDVRTMFMDKEEARAEGQARMERLFAEAGISNEQKDIVKDLLIDLFPALGEIINGNNAPIDLAELREEGKVGHRDALDAYFALTISQSAYLRHEKWISELVSGISGADDAEIMRRIEEYTARARADDSETDGITLLRNELLKQKHHGYQLMVFRAWMRVILKDTQAVVHDDNRALGRVLSALNDIAQKNQPNERLKIGRYVFRDVTKYLAKPDTALLLLLFLLPERSNGYLEAYVAKSGFSQGGLYQRVLKWVDTYFAKRDINIYKDYDYPDWSFVAYQWALSIRSGGQTPNRQVVGAVTRYQRVNDYLFSMLDRDDKVAYKFFYDRFWRTESLRQGSGEVGWRVDSETVPPYEPPRLLALAQKLAKSDKLTAAQKKLLRSFVGDLEVYISSLETKG